MELKNRIEWVDYYKALAIILVVIGHSTGIMNKYIYQFHVPAFFFISGYLTNISGMKMDEIIIRKGLTLILPYVFWCSFGLIIFDILQKLNVLKYVSMHSSIPPLRNNICSMFTALYCDWFGATWFLVSLFGVCILSKMMSLINNDKIGIVYIGLSVMLFTLGYDMIRNNNTIHIFGFNIHHFMIIQGFFSFGVFVRIYFSNIIQRIKGYFWVISTIICIGNFYIIHKCWNTTIDLASNYVNLLYQDVLMVVNGIIFLLSLSKMIEKIPKKKIKIIMKKIGENTLAILMFHFIGFKIVTILLSLCGFCNINEVSLLVPSPNGTSKYWYLYTFISIIFSIGLWNMLCKIKIIRILNGQDRDFVSKVCKLYNNYVR